MRENWRKVRFGDVVQFPPKIKLKKGKSYPHIPMENLDSGIKYVKPLIEKKLKGSGAKFEEGDTLFSRITPCLQNGKIAQAKDLNSKPGFGSTEYFVFRGIENVSDSDFIYYFSKTQWFKGNAINSMVGSSGRQRADAGFVRNLKINLPPLPIQRKIAGILSAYDDLIENNLKRIKLLEERAQLIFELAFGDKEIHKTWTEKSLGEMLSFDIGGGWGKEAKKEKFPKPAYVIRGTDIDKIKKGQVGNVPFRWHKSSNFKSRELKYGDVVFEVSGGSTKEGVGKTILITNELLDLFNDDVICASFCKLMRPSKTEYSHFLYFYIKYLRSNKITEVYEKRSASNIVNYNWKAFLKNQTIKIPDDDFLEDFNHKIESIYKVIFNLGNQNQHLKEARDLLLPRLMMGLVDVDALLGDNVNYEIEDNELGIAAEGSANYEI